MPDFSPLDNPVWSALHARHAHLALTAGMAARYPAEVAPFAALREPTPAAFEDLRGLVRPGEAVAMPTATEIAVPDGWKAVQRFGLVQMAYAGQDLAPRELNGLGDADVPDMLALTTLTRPGPFLAGTIRMGAYFGIRTADGRLAAMAGERFKPEAFTEVSGVCTDPTERGKGHAAHLLGGLVTRILAEGRTPFLHALPDNPAVALYQRLGFVIRRSMHLVVVMPIPPEGELTPQMPAFHEPSRG